MRGIAIGGAAALLVAGGGAWIYTRPQMVSGAWSTVRRHASDAWGTARRHTSDAWLAVRRHLPFGTPDAKPNTAVATATPPRDAVRETTATRGTRHGTHPTKQVKKRRRND